MGRGAMLPLLVALLCLAGAHAARRGIGADMTPAVGRAGRTMLYTPYTKVQSVSRPLWAMGQMCMLRRWPGSRPPWIESVAY